jgi:hypothetical protein
VWEQLRRLPLRPVLSRGLLRLQAVQQALGQYREEVEARGFPSEAFSPYQITDEHRAAAAEAARAEGFLAAAAALDPGDRA